MKKAWESPKLIVLVRSRPEEAVLTTCKYHLLFSSPSENYPSCAQGGLTAIYCDDCNAAVQS